MKLTTENEQILGNTTAGTGFTIATSAKAFQILSSGIYKHKIRAIVREVACNANDAHIVSGQTKPWVIQSPTELDSRFIVRDFGPGLSHEDMTTVYTRYFESTKSEDSAQTGAFGLGAKSPFAYTNTFSVTSYHEGICRIYNAMVIDGGPQLSLVYEGEFEDGDETGIEVVVPVTPSDLSSWRSEILRILRPFKPGTYTLKSLADAVHPFEARADFNTDYFTGYDKSDSNRYEGQHGLYAIYANIVYPLNGMYEGAEWLLAKSPVTYIHFGPDTLNPQPSREELQDDVFTIRNVKERIKELNDRVLKADIEELCKIENPRELLRRVHKLPQAHLTALENMGTTFYNGMTLADAGRNQKFKPILDFNYKTLYEVNSQSPLARQLVESKSWKWRHSRTKVTADSYLNYTNKELFVLIHDESAKMRHSLRGLVLSDEPNTPKSGDYVLVVSQEKFDELYVLLRRIMCDDPIHVFKNSECEKYRKLIPNYGVKTKRTSTTRPSAPNVVKYTLAKEGTYWATKELHLSTNEIAKLTGYVLGIKSQSLHAKSEGFAQLVNYRSQPSQRDIFVKCGINSFYLVRPTVFKRASKNDNLICVYKKVEDELRKMVNAVDQSQYHPAPKGFLAERLIETEELKFLADRLGLIENYDDHTKDLDDICSRMNSLRAHSYSPVDQNAPLQQIAKLRAVHLDRDNIALTQYTDALEKLRAQNKLVFFALENACDTDLTDLIPEIKNLLGA